MRRGSFSFTLSPSASRRSFTQRRLFLCRAAPDQRSITGTPSRAGRHPAQSEAPGRPAKSPRPETPPPSSPGAAAKRPTRDQQAAPPETSGKNGRGRVRRLGSKSRQDARTKNRQGRKMKGWSGEPGRPRDRRSRNYAQGRHRTAAIQRGIHAGNGRAATPVIPADRETFPGTAKTGRTLEPLRRSPRRDGPRTRPLNPTGG